MPRLSLVPSVLSGLLLVTLALPALAQRELRFDERAAPGEGTVALLVGEGEQATASALAGLDSATRDAVARAMKASRFTGKSDTQLDLPGVGRFDRVLLVGLGAGEATPRVLQDAGGRIGQFAAGIDAPRVEMIWSGDAAGATQLAFGAALGQYRFDKYRSPDPQSPRGRGGELVVRSAGAAAAAEAYRSQWKPVADAVRFSRDLVTEPANAVWPEEFVARTRSAFAGIPNIRIEVLDVAAMERLGMGGMLAVGKGSERPPRLLVVRYDGAREGAPLAFVGKGITFDSGGISLKDAEGMWRMKYDMSGAAAVTGAVLALAGRRAPVNAIAVAALAENMPSGGAARPGDVVTTMSGKTFEIMSTDAEGRMVLSDAVWYAQDRYRPRVVIDVATLTGSIVTALGDEYAGLFTREDALATQLLAAGEASGEPLWRMPLHPSYAKDLASPIADLRNGGSRNAGAGLGAHFIGEWIVEGTPWAHLDIAGMAWRESEGTATSPAGATGFGVRLLDRLVRDHYE
jgi:leucyl aminopeptidase